MNAPLSFSGLPSPFRPAAARALDPQGKRPAGPQCGTRDPWRRQRAGFVVRAWEQARLELIDTAIGRHTGAAFHGAVGRVVAEVLAWVDILALTNSGELGALGTGPKGLPSRSVGTGTGYALALRLLGELAAGALSAPIVERLDGIDRAFSRAVELAWNSSGSRLELRASADAMADAVGAFFGLLVQALVAHLARELAGPARGRLRPALERLSAARLFAESDGLDVWVLRHYDTVRDQLMTGEHVPSLLRSATPAISLSSTVTPQIRPNAPLPDVRALYQFREERLNSETHKIGSGPLGVPGRVVTHRNTAAQRGVSAGTGDDAGHLIGDRFGAPGGPENLSAQNWVSNRYGTYKALEDAWAESLRGGTEITVTVTDKTKDGDDRPYVREVRWTELTPEGLETAQSLTFMNPHTPKSREMRGIAPTVSSPQENNVINVDFKNRTRLP